MLKKMSNLAWLDLEMTGLNPEEDVILEIACVVTDANLNILAQMPSIVIHHTQEVLDKSNDWVKTIHSANGLFDEVLKSNISVEEAMSRALDFFQTYCFEGVVPLCGNSIWNDRRFLRRYMPALDNFFHYRIVDVSSIREVLKRWYPGNPALTFKKSEDHRAHLDTIQSIEELEHYRKNFFIPSTPAE